MTAYNLLIFMQQSQYSLLLSSVFKTTHAQRNPYSESIDIISVGTVLKDAYQDSQQRTFGTHEMVRSFYRITEPNDTDSSCFNDLTTDQIDDVIKFCSVTEGESFESKLFRNILFQPKKHAGWICAQKRPIDGLYKVLQKYSHDHVSIPDYLALIDDDTYLNLDSILAVLHEAFPPTDHNVLAGCNFRFLNYKSAFTFPYGGFGSFLPRASIERLLQPIDCSSVDKEGVAKDPFTRLTCWRLEQNALGEKAFFQDGMSVADLMFQFATKQPFGDVENWKNGFCFHRYVVVHRSCLGSSIPSVVLKCSLTHIISFSTTSSDHAMAYFLNFYHIAVPDDELKSEDFAASDEYRKKYKYQGLTKVKGRGRVGECSNERDRCKHDDKVCHYIEPDQMDNLWSEHLKAQRKNQEAKVTGETLLVGAGIPENVTLTVSESAV